MAVRFDTVTDRLIRSASVLDYNSPYTALMWVYLVADRNAWGDIFSIGNNATLYDNIGVNGTGTILNWGTQGGDAPPTPDLGVGAWVHLTMCRSSVTSLFPYVNGVAGTVFATTVAGRAASNRMEINGTAAGTEYMDMRVAAVKIYSVALTAEEVQAEMRQYTPHRTENLVLWSPLLTHTDLADYSGLGRDWTAAGTLATEDGPPIPWRLGSERFYIVEDSVVTAPSLLFRPNPMRYLIVR